MVAPEAVISILAVTLLGTAGLLSMLPVGTCAECPHCRLQKLEHERQRQLQSEGTAVGGPFCPMCGRYHRADEEHKL
jgi:hypothetical protein